MAKQVALGEAARVEIISLVDNTVDFISKIERKDVQQVRKWMRDCMTEEWTRRHLVCLILNTDARVLAQLT